MNGWVAAGIFLAGWTIIVAALAYGWGHARAARAERALARDRERERRMALGRVSEPPTFVVHPPRR